MFKTTLQSTWMTSAIQTLLPVLNSVSKRELSGRTCCFLTWNYFPFVSPPQCRTISYFCYLHNYRFMASKYFLLNVTFRAPRIKPAGRALQTCLWVRNWIKRNALSNFLMWSAVDQRVFIRLGGKERGKLEDDRRCVECLRHGCYRRGKWTNHEHVIMKL